MHKDLIDVIRGRGAAATNELAIKGTELLRMFVKRELTKQWRAEEKIHNERVRQMREDEAPLMRERLMKMKQLTTEEAHTDE